MHIRPCAAHFKPLSVVLAECGHFVVTWSVQDTERLFNHIATKRHTETD